VDLLRTNAIKLNIDLSQYQIDQFELFYRELISQNKRVNLTAITGYDDVQIKHFVDSLTPIPHLCGINTDKVIDVGSGAGFPGIPLKIALPHIKLTLIESRGKKAQFLSHLTSVLKLNNVSVLYGRVEDFARESVHRESYDISLTRAVSSLSTVLEYTLPLCKVGGYSICYRAAVDTYELEEANTIASLLGGCLYKNQLISADEQTTNRSLIFFSKVSPTPAKYPRKPGIPSKRPL